MRYVLLICGEEEQALSRTPEEQAELLAAFTAFSGELAARGLLVAQERLRPTSSATTVRRRDDELVVADGPFAETKEQIAGFFVIECGDLDEAIAVAAQVPSVSFGTVEVRPVWEM